MFLSIQVPTQSFPPSSSHLIGRATTEHNDTRHMSPDSSPSDGEEEEPETLRDLLYENLVMSRFDNTPHKFVPEGVLDALITEEEIRTVLSISKPNDQKLVDFIRMHAKKAFATMVMARYDAARIIKDMRWLQNHKRDDKDLPIARLDEWPKAWRRDFYDEHWKFLAAVFLSSKHNHDLVEARILPFISETTDGGQGSFGVVTRHVIHKNHMIPVRSVRYLETIAFLTLYRPFQIIRPMP
jgi:hypothetical protein